MALSKALYFVALVPPSAIEEEVLVMKMEIKKRFGAAHALKLPAHITLIPPIWLEREQEFANVLQSVAEEQLVLPVKLKNFGHFGQRVIYINVEDHEPIQELHQLLSRSLAKFLPEGKNANLQPHITVATRDLTREKFQMAWEEFRNRFYHTEFGATALTLFKHNGKTWDIIKAFSFSEREGS